MWKGGLWATAQAKRCGDPPLGVPPLVRGWQRWQDLREDAVPTTKLQRCGVSPSKGHITASLDMPLAPTSFSPECGRGHRKL